jgi:hypothetical protein
MVGRTSKQAIIGAILSGFLAGLMGCTSLSPTLEPTALAAKPQPKVVRTTPPPKVIGHKKGTVKKVVLPVEEAPAKPPVVPPLGGGSGGGSGGGGWG